MTTILHLAVCVVVAAASWLALLLAVGTLIHGRAWVWAQTRDAWRQQALARSSRRLLPQRRIPPPPDEPIAVAPRGGWL